MNKPDWPVTVSIITPCHNQAAYVGEAIESVLGQTMSDWEMLIIDDGSKDNSAKVIQQYQKKDKRLKFLQTKNTHGPAKARNKAIGEARGRFIAFLDGDDIWYPEKLEKQIQFMEKKSSALSFTWCDVMTEEGARVSEITGRACTKSYGALARNPTVAGGLTAIYDRHHLDTQYMPDILKRQDLGLWLKILRQIPEAHCLQEKLGCYRLRMGSVSANKRVGAKYTWKLYRDVEKLSFLRAAYYFTCYTINGFCKTYFKNLRR